MGSFAQLLKSEHIHRSIREAFLAGTWLFSGGGLPWGPRHPGTGDEAEPQSQEEVIKKDSVSDTQ